MVNHKIIEQILDQANIVDVVSQYVSLKKKGINYEACCPFHGEKTPSFKISPSKGIWTCFGACQESGNVIKFVQKQEGVSFPEACKMLALKYGIKWEEREMTADEMKAAHKREALIAINTACAKYFVAQLHSPAGKRAYDYSVKRWSKDFVQLYGIGYAPAGWDDFVEWAIEKGLNTSMLEELGLISPRDKGGYYSFFRDRVMIPIRDKYQNIIGFTARYIGPEEGKAKYINSKESILYHKGSCIFGIDFAKKIGTKESKFYLVEGGPDVLRLQSIGIDNTVASLGTAWTDKQFDQLKKMAGKICFIPDADELKPGQTYGTGIEKVLKNGKAAIAAGLSVSVIEIPVGEGNTKQDPDSYFTNRSIFAKALNKETDFIVWFAKTKFASVNGNDERSAVIKDIACMVAQLNDEVKESMYLQELNSLYKNRSLWAQAINAEKKKMNESSGDFMISQNDLQKFGFFERHNCYFSINEKGGDFKWSNFTMTPLYHIRGAYMPKRLYLVKNEFGREEFIEMKQEDLVSLQKFKTVLEGTGNFIWEAGDKELTKLKAMLYSKTMTAEEVTQMGWNKKGCYIFGNGILLDRKFYQGDEYGIVRLPDDMNFYIPALSKFYSADTQIYSFERNFVNIKLQEMTLADYLRQIVETFGNNGRIAIAFIVATCFRDIIFNKTNFFPILDIFGPKGTGKSELAMCLMAMFQVKPQSTMLTNSTIPGITNNVAACANAPVHLEEYKNNIGTQKVEFIKNIWDGKGRSKVNLDKDKKTETTKIDSGVILTGQEIPTADIAMFSRLIFLMFSKTTFTNDERKKFNTLKKMKENGVSHLCVDILNCRPIFEQEFGNNYKYVSELMYERLYADFIEDRLVNNWSVILAAVRTIEGHLPLPFTFMGLLDICLTAVKEQNKLNKQNNDLANFWNVVSYLQQDGLIFNESDYKIKIVTSLKTVDKEKMYKYDDGKEVLFLRKSRIIALYRKYGYQVGDNILPAPTLESYLRYSDEYLGKKNSERFKQIQRGEEVLVTVRGENRQSVETTSTVDQALCFDYKALNRNYGINLKVDTGKFDIYNEIEN